MRRIALLGLTLLLPACQTLVGNPLDGAGGFLADTHTYHLNPNRPAGDAPNLLRAEGQQVALPPLTPEPGDVWPGPIAPEPTLLDIQRQDNEAALNSAAPPSAVPATPPLPPRSSAPAGNGVRTYTDPKGGTGIVVPNGNGTSTLIGPDGAVTSVPTPH